MNSSDKEVFCSVEHIGKCSVWDQEHIEKDEYWQRDLEQIRREEYCLWNQEHIEKDEYWPWDPEHTHREEY
jgi:hypothetical protein